MKKRLLQLLGLYTCLLSSLTLADGKAVEDAIRKALPGVAPDTIRPAAMPGFFEVTIGPKLFYVSEDGRYLIQGTLFDLSAKQDLTEPRVAEARLSALNKMGQDGLISFKPKEQKRSVFVFTDIDCGYCRKLHSEIDQYLKEGIAVQYLFFPRTGEDSPSYDKAVSVWCAKDRNDAMTRAKKGESIESRKCDNPVSKHMALGNALGVQGTPMIVTDKGNLLPGYMSASQLAAYLTHESEK
jgi:thiol:disulfide interchange protein DsbC